ncbi:Ribonuclease inhibitor [Seminavis robusta]|uniref:Ribonuclease inhibitor n=1 Tax=Seminavis robusta TaxID=568900 RepID=A0A9N8E561_9STRA|nr:Ribonuclease inhibitor [Seminavis robusta]|eukprot:Sro560_g166670.1 Ribonuclease inhibitor (530) ;mRNA; f:21850-23439
MPPLPSTPGYSTLCDEFPLLSFCFQPKADSDTINEDESIDLVLRYPLRRAEFGETLEELRLLGRHPVALSSIRSVFVHKDVFARVSMDQQQALYATLGESLGAKLTEFSLSLLKMSIPALAQLLQKMPNLEKLHLGRVSLVQRDQAVQLYAALQKKLPNLREFHWSLMPAPDNEAPLFQPSDDDNNNNNNPCMDPLLISLAQIPTLECVYLAAHRPRGGRIQTAAALKALAQSHVTDLTLVNIPLTPAHVHALMMTSTNHSFTSLALLHAEIGDVGAQIIVQSGLFKNLKKLYLPACHLTDVSGIALAGALRNSNTSLQVLDVHDNHLTAAFCQSLTLQSLQFLDVSYNPLRDAGGMALAAALEHNTKLSTLYMFQNQITDQTCAALATALYSNRHLKQVNLYNNPKVSTQGVQSLLHHLEDTNYVLERLEVSPLESRETEEALDFLLTLNRNYGRKQVLSLEKEQEYLEQGLVKAMAQDDLNSLFYFLKRKPTLCQQQKQPPSRRKPCSNQAIATIALEACAIAGEGM